MMFRVYSANRPEHLNKLAYHCEGDMIVRLGNRYVDMKTRTSLAEAREALQNGIRDVEIILSDRSDLRRYVLCMH